MATSKTPAPAANDGRRSIQSIEVGVPLLAALVDAAKPLTLRDLAAGAGMTSAKAHPYLVSFIRVGLVQQDTVTGQYELGPFALQMGLVSLQRLDPVRIAMPEIDHVVLEATGNTAAIVNVLRQHVARVAIANPLQVRLIAEARVKTDKIDAAVLAQLYASHFLPEVWMPDENTLALRRQVSRRAQLVRQRTRLKNEVHAVLAAHLIDLLI